MSEVFHTQMSHQERVAYFQNLKSFEGRSGLRVPRYELDKNIEPNSNILKFFNILWEYNGLANGTRNLYENELWIPADHRQPLVIRGSYRGISENGLSIRRQRLSEYRDIKNQKTNIKSSLSQLVELDPTDEQTDNVIKQMRRELLICELKMDQIVSENAGDQSAKHGRDTNGTKGVASHEILLPPTNQVGPPRVFVRVSHRYFLPEEQKQYNLPEWQGNDQNRFRRYPFQGKEGRESTKLWYMGREISAQNYVNDIEYSSDVQTVFSEIVDLLSENTC